MYSFYLDEAHRNLVLGNADEAIANFEKAIEYMEEIDTNVIVHLGFLYFEAGQHHRAKTIFKKVSQLDNNVEAYYGLGGIAEEEGNLDRAIDYYHVALKIDKNHEYAHFNLGGIYTDRGEFKLALQHYKRVISINKGNFWAYMNTGNVYEKMNKNKEAYKYFEKAYNIDPGHSKALFNLGVACAKLGQYEDAITWYNNSIQVEDTYEFAYLNLALIYKDIFKDEQKALEIYTAGIDHFPDNSVLIYNRACTFAVMGNVEESVVDLLESFKLDPSLIEYALDDDELVEVLKVTKVNNYLNKVDDLAN